MPRQRRSAAPATATAALSIEDYLKKILCARVYDVAVETDLQRAPRLSKRLGNHVWLKREDNQPVFSFKIRGAYNKMAQLPPDALARGVICASAGNHAQGVALSAARLGCKSTIVMPNTTPLVKIEAVKALGGQVVLHGDSFSDAYVHALELEKQQGSCFIHPFDDPEVIAGQGTVAMEILRQHRGPLDAIFVAIGGGGLIAGVAAYVKALRPEVKVIGVQMRDSDAMLQSVRAGQLVHLQDVGLFSDGTAVKRVGTETFRLVKDLVDDYVVVDTDAVCAAIKDVFQDTRSILEPAGAMGVAAIKQYAATHGSKDQHFVAITCGANMNFDRLRLVAERAELGESREALFAVTIPEERGSFLKFCETIGQRSVTEFNYRMSDAARAHIFVGLSIAKPGDSAQIAKRFAKAGFECLDLTHDELAKTHVRHMVGGASADAQDELLFRFVFPERPGALMRFLSSLSPSWNISLFHYRYQGADDGQILVGIQVPPKERRQLARSLDELAYPYVEETDNPVYRLFLR